MPIVENKDDLSYQESVSHRIGFCEQLREGYIGSIVFVSFFFLMKLWVEVTSPLFRIEDFNEMLVFFSSLIVPAYLSVFLPFKILGELKNNIQIENVLVIRDAYSHHLEKATLIVFVLAPFILTFSEVFGVIIFMSYYTFVIDTMRKQTWQERTTLLTRIVAIISIWLSLVLFIFR